MPPALSPLPYQSAIEAMFHDAPMAVVVLDREGRVRVWNRAAERLTGWTAAEVLGELPPYIPPEHVDGFRMRHAAAFEGGELPAITVQRIRRDGAAMEVVVARTPIRDERGEAVALIGFLADVTERRREEEQQRRAEANFRTLIERSPDGIVVHRLGQIVFANPRMVAMLGYQNPEQLVGMPVLSLVHPEDRASVGERIRRASGGTEVPPATERLIRRDGGTVIGEIIGLPVVFDGEPAVLAHVRDLTAQLHLETELRARDRLASVGRLAAAIGHEINNPLAYVMANLEIALRTVNAMGDAGAELARRLSDAHEGADRVRLIVRDLKTFSQRESDETGAIDLRRVLDSCVAMAQHEIRHRARVRKDYAELPFVLGNEARLGQVFLNLLINAAQAIPEGHVDDHEVAIVGRANGERVEIAVHDTGVGIERAALGRLFEPFYTTKSANGGTGLGLAICRSIVAALGGEIHLESEPGKGTVAVVSLPRADASASPASVPSSRNAGNVARRRVLIVDDEPRVARSIAAVLTGDETALAQTGDEALARLRRGEVYDAVLCDLMMPSMSGMELYERIRAEHPGLERRMIFMTGGAFTPRGTAFLASIANPCLEKPFQPKQLWDALARATRR